MERGEEWKGWDTLPFSQISASVPALTCQSQTDQA